MKNKVLRYIFFLSGVLINSFGIAFITKAALGTSPISSLPYVLSLKFEPSFGLISFVINSIFILLQICILRKDFQIIQLMQFFVNIIFSLFIDFSMMILSLLNPSHIILQIIALIIGCAILGFGISVEVAANVVFVPGEGLVDAINQKLKKKFGTVKICFDSTLVFMAFISSFIFFHEIRGIGIGTIISALLVGKFVNIYNKYLPFISYIKNLDS